VNIKDSEVLHVAGLARLKLDPDEVKKFSMELNSILEYMQMLSEVDTTDIAPMHHTFPGKNTFRTDETAASQNISKALQNAPQHKGGHILVPKVIE